MLLGKVHKNPDIDMADLDHLCQKETLFRVRESRVHLTRYVEMHPLISSPAKQGHKGNQKDASEVADGYALRHLYDRGEEARDLRAVR